MPTSINYDYSSSSYLPIGSSVSNPVDPNFLIGLFSSFSAIFLLIFFIIIVSNWRIFTKAGKPGWASLVPIYNLVVMLRIASMPGWMLVLFFIPLANAFVGLIMQAKIVKSFGKSTGFVIGYFFLPLIFLPILAFDSSQYVGDGTNSTPPQPNTPPQTPTSQNPNPPQTITPPVTVLPPVPPSTPPQTPTTNI